MPTKSWRTHPEKTLSVRGALLRFAFTRTELLEARVSKLRVPIEDLGGSGALDPNHFDLIFGPGDGREDVPFEFARRRTRAALWSSERVSVQFGERLELELDYLGEEPILVDVEWLTTVLPSGDPGPTDPIWPSWFGSLSDRDRARFSHDVRLETRVRHLEGSVEDSTAASLLAGAPQDDGPDALFAARGEAIELTCKIQRFFLELDSRTTPEALGKATLDACEKGLALFAGQRATCGDDGYRYSFVPDEELASSLRKVSNVFEACMADAGLAEADLPFAFEQFVAGRLSVVHRDGVTRDLLKTHGATNSWFYFLFSELALACARSSDLYFTEEIRKRWAGRVPFFVRTAHLLSTYQWAKIVNPIELAPVTPFAYFDGFSMKFERVEASREQYAAAVVLWAIDGLEPLEEDALARWEDVLGKVLKETPSFQRLTTNTLWFDPAYKTFYPDDLPGIPSVGVQRLATVT